MTANETPEDIIAEYRADVTSMFANDLPPPTPDYVALLLNRIEEAVGRRTVAEARIRHCHGNSAALREALANVERVAKYCAETPRHTPGYPTDAARADVLYSRIAELGRVARAALASPARNADRFATVGAAHKAWRATKQERDFADWLFAPAKEGETK